MRAVDLWERRLFADAPEFARFANDFGEFVKGGWFMEVGVRAEMIRAEDILVLARGGKDDDGDDMAIGMSAQPFENLKAGAARHLQIGDEETGKWKPGPVPILPLALEIVNGVLPVRAGVNRVVKAIF